MLKINYLNINKKDKVYYFGGTFSVLIDFHVHVFPKAIRDERNLYFLDEPEFKTLYSFPKDKMVGCSKVIEMMEECKINTSVIFGFPWRNYNTCRVNNDYVIKMVQKEEPKLKGFCCVDPFHPMAPNEVERCLKAGLSGVGEIAFYKKGIDDDCINSLESIMDICLNYDCPILIHTNEEIGHKYRGKTRNTLEQIYKTIKRFPKNIIILSHWGGGILFFSLLKEKSTKVFSKVYYDIAASPFLYKKQIYLLVKNIIGTNKVIFGTDYPLIHPNRYLTEIFSSGLSIEEINNICFYNAANLLKI